MAELKAMHMLRCRLQQIALGPDETGERHHDFFANRVDRRIGDLGKQLLEVVVDHARFIGQAGQCAVVTHRAEGITRFSYHWQ